MANRETSLQILDLAQELCQSRGFNAFSYKDIAERLKIKTASIHYHYPTKSDLGEALIERYRNEFNQALAEIRSKTSDPKKQLQQFGALIADLQKGKKICLCAVLASELETLEQGMKKKVRDFFNETEQWLETCLINGKKSGAFSFSKPAKTVAGVMMATAQGMLICSKAYDGMGNFSEGRDWLFSTIQA